jgi:hypothetical protein
LALTPERKAQLKTERDALFAELKRRLEDRGIAGVPACEFHLHLGIPPEPADGAGELNEEEKELFRQATRRRRDSSDLSYRGGVAWPVHREISDATWNRISRELDRLQGKSDPSPLRATSSVPSTRQPRVTAAALEKIDREMDEAFAKNVARSICLREACKLVRRLEVDVSPARLAGIAMQLLETCTALPIIQEAEKLEPSLLARSVKIAIPWAMKIEHRLATERERQ